MKSSTLSSLVTLSLLFVAGAAPAQDVLISEFMASNLTAHVDEDGDYSDWLELYAATGDIDLNGWYLTDDPALLTKWQIPDVQLGAQRYLVIYASEKDKTEPDGTLHTNFRLEQDGEYLALVEPDGVTVHHAYDDVPLDLGGSGYPPQITDYSYGIAQGASIERAVRSGDNCRALVPTGNIGTTWRNHDFNDGSWGSGRTGIGYEAGSGYEALIETDLRAAMQEREHNSLPAGVLQRRRR